MSIKVKAAALVGGAMLASVLVAAPGHADTCSSGWVCVYDQNGNDVLSTNDSDANAYYTGYFETTEIRNLSDMTVYYTGPNNSFVVICPPHSTRFPNATFNYLYINFG